ncbi:MAG: hypothetical protein HY736_23570 [Verrucomicrobia bacterium]|nr:hypothetical protein [Verrucomicrobiota bacterium]
MQIAILLRAAFRPLHLSIQRLAFFLCALALLAGLAAQGGGGDFCPNQPLYHLLGLSGRHLADGQRGDFLHRWRLRAFGWQAQGRIRGKAPPVAAPAFAAHSLHPNLAKAGLEIYRL